MIFDEKRDKFEKAIDQWIEGGGVGSLIPMDGAIESGVLPLWQSTNLQKVTFDLSWITED